VFKSFLVRALNGIAVHADLRLGFNNCQIVLWCSFLDLFLNLEAEINKECLHSADTIVASSATGIV